MKNVEKVFKKVCRKYGTEKGQFTKADFYRICAGENIDLTHPEYDLRNNTTVTADLAQSIGSRGFYLTIESDNEAYIFLASFFQKRFNRQTAFHELGHHFLRHEGNLWNYDDKRAELEQQETEADYFAYLATGLNRKGKNGQFI